MLKPRLVMTELRRAAFSSKKATSVPRGYLPTSDFILRHDDSWRTLRTDKHVIETNNKNEIIQ